MMSCPEHLMGFFVTAVSKKAQKSGMVVAVDVKNSKNILCNIHRTF